MSFQQDPSQVIISGSHIALARSTLPQFHLLNTALNDFSNNPAYIMHLTSTNIKVPPSASNPNPAVKQCVASAHSDHVIKLYEFGDGGRTLHFVNQLVGHEKVINDLNFAASHAHVLCSASEEGRVLCWDVRNAKQCNQMSSPKRTPLFSVSCSGTLLAAGSTEGQVFLWDVRKPDTLLKTYDQFHNDDVTQLQFHPHNPKLLLSGGEDGLICCVDLSVADQDEALKTVLNPEQPISKMGFFGPNGEFMYCLSTVETFSLWSIKKGQPIANFGDCRSKLSDLSGTTIDYFIDCHYDSPSQRLFLAAGSNSGGLTICHVNKDDIQPFCQLNNSQQQPANSQNGTFAFRLGENKTSSSSSFSMDDELELASSSPPSSSFSSSSSAPSLYMDTKDDGADEEDVDDVHKHERDVQRRGEMPWEADSASSSSAVEEKDPERDFSIQGHEGVIRDLLWMGSNILTGGHDSRLCVWSTDAPTPDQQAKINESYKMKRTKSEGQEKKQNPKQQQQQQHHHRNKNNRNRKPQNQQGEAQGRRKFTPY